MRAGLVKRIAGLIGGFAVLVAGLLYSVHAQQAATEYSRMIFFQTSSPGIAQQGALWVRPTGSNYLLSTTLTTGTYYGVTGDVHSVILTQAFNRFDWTGLALYVQAGYIGSNDITTLGTSIWTVVATPAALAKIQ